MRLVDMVDGVISAVIPDDPPALIAVVRDLITLRNAAESQLVIAAVTIDRLGLAKHAGSTTSKLLQANGAPRRAVGRVAVATDRYRVAGFGSHCWLLPRRISLD
ncbi:hypothetical protein [Williamsia sp. D3]|uniref:hypothetical protein n=1 Tax=Williamsia sp. D3 TaxID=1313067 RepID=UPI0003FAD066|nr:hypothetical protein [Williamsia sp. D3]